MNSLWPCATMLPYGMDNIIKMATEMLLGVNWQAVSRGRGDFLYEASVNMKFDAQLFPRGISTKSCYNWTGQGVPLFNSLAPGRF